MYKQTNIFKLIYSILGTLQAEPSSLGEGRKESSAVFVFSFHAFSMPCQLLGYNLVGSYLDICLPSNFFFPRASNTCSNIYIYTVCLFVGPFVHLYTCPLFTYSFTYSCSCFATFLPSSIKERKR